MSLSLLKYRGNLGPSGVRKFPPFHVLKGLRKTPSSSGNRKEGPPALTWGDSAGARAHQVAGQAGDRDAAEPGLGGDSREEHGVRGARADAFGETLELQGGGRDPPGPPAAEAKAAVPGTPFD